MVPARSRRASQSAAVFTAAGRPFGSRGRRMERDYLVWSNEHRAWWGPAGRGYVRRVSEAGRYSWPEALAICSRAIPGDAERFGLLPELPVRLADVQAMQTSFHALYPDLAAGCWE